MGDNINEDSDFIENMENADVEAGKNAQNAPGNKLKKVDLLEQLGLCDGTITLIRLPKSVQRAIKALKRLHLSHVNIEVDFCKELHALEMKYEKLFQTLYAQRRLIVSGAHIPTDEECELPVESEKDSEGDELENAAVEDVENNAEIKGIPEFWLTALKNSPSIADIIEEYDEPILKHLTDVTCNTSDNPMSFVLEFHFEPNEYFTNEVLTKFYEYKCTPDPSDAFTFDGTEIFKCKGCTIDWKRGKNVTVKTIKKKQKHKARGSVRTLTRTVQNESFFNFFSPPMVPETVEDEQVDEDTRSSLMSDFEIGSLLKDTVIPHAVLFFTGENSVDDDFDDGDDDEYDEDEDEEEEEEDEEENETQCLVIGLPASTEH